LLVFGVVFDLNIEKISLDHKNLRRLWSGKIFL